MCWWTFWTLKICFWKLWRRKNRTQNNVCRCLKHLHQAMVSLISFFNVEKTFSQGVKFSNTDFQAFEKKKSFSFWTISRMYLQHVNYLYRVLYDITYLHIITWGTVWTGAVWGLSRPPYNLRVWVRGPVLSRRPYNLRVWVSGPILSRRPYNLWVCLCGPGVYEVCPDLITLEKVFHWTN